jgi:proteasome lid subunit RPN8/RPN11
MILVPPAALRSACRHAQLNPLYEVGGMFVVDAGGRVRYLLGSNIAQDPTANVELDAEWIYDNTVGADQDVLAFFHSHPGGQSRPSEWDMSVFPQHYVSKALIYFGYMDRVIVYDSQAWDIVGVEDGDGIKIELVT